MNGILPGSAIGFARHAGESLHPSLWAKYVGPLVPWYCGRNCPDPSPSRYDGAMAGTSSALSIVGSPLGPALKLSGNVSMQWNGHSTLGNKFKLENDDEKLALTIQAVFRYSHKPSSHPMTLFWSDVPTVGDPYGYQLWINANTDRAVFTIYDGAPGAGAAMEWSTASSLLTGGKWHRLTMTYYAWDVDDFEIAQRVVFWLDGQMHLSTTETVTRSNIAYSNALHSKIGGRTSGFDPDFEISLLSIWNRRLAWREIDVINADPLAVFRRPAPVFSKAARRISLGGVTLNRLSPILAG